VKKIIDIKGARANNLKGIDVQIPHGKITVITGVSGSGKSSLAFDTLYAEGQRRFVESMPAYVRQFLGKLNKPEMDYIKGLSPAIAIQQKVISTNPRSTVGTTTEIYDYLKLLFAREGKTYSPLSGDLVKKDTAADVLYYIQGLPDPTPIAILAPIGNNPKRTFKDEISLLEKEGFSRVYVNQKIELINQLDLSISPEEFHVVIDRFPTNCFQESEESRVVDSIQIAFGKGLGCCAILNLSNQEMSSFNNKFERDGMLFQEPSVYFFTFNNPYGACKTCEGYGQVLGIDPALVIPDEGLSIVQGAIQPWRSEVMDEYLQSIILNAKHFDFPIHKPYRSLSPEQKALLWDGNKYFTGLHKYFKWVESQSYKIQYRVILSRYRGKTICPECQGTRLRGDASYVKFFGRSLQEIVQLSIDDGHAFFEKSKAEIESNNVLKRILPEIINRLRVLKEVGLGYLTLNRATNSLSGGESQRIHLATSLGSSLVGSTYVLDEPSIGLHPRDTQRLIKVLESLKAQGNTVVIVEHEEEIMRAADYIIDIGPLAGYLGGEVVFAGDFTQMLKKGKSLTAQYLTDVLEIPLPNRRRKSPNYIQIQNATLHNLKDITTRIPLNSLVTITGVSGSGKSTLIKEFLFPGLKQVLYDRKQKLYKGATVSGDTHLLNEVVFIDQNPIGKSSRSNPVTYLKAFDDIREIFAKQPIAKMRNYKPGFFSFNIDGGRCEICEGEGIITVGMQFMADIQLTCDTCLGKRYKTETLEVVYREKNIAEILEMTIDEAYVFFNEASDRLEQRIAALLKPLLDVGLGYLKAGQASSTMSGGEAQRIKLASFLAKGNTQQPTLFIFDEPTTGLHFHDIDKLMHSFYALIHQGHSIVVIEHNIDVIKCADWIIDIGPDSGIDGGTVTFEGTPEDLVKMTHNHTATFLKPKLVSQ